MDKWEKITITLPAQLADIASEFIISVTERGVETKEPGAGNLSALTQITTWLTPKEIGDGLLDRISHYVSEISSATPDSHYVNIDREAQKESNWAEEWKKFFKPIRAGNHFLIRPHWEEAPLDPPDIEIIIDPGQAFGVGTHASTALMLASMEWLWEQKGKGRYRPEVLDIGTGTGILGIAACKLGASGVTAIDIDPEAARAASENTHRNHVAHLMDTSTTPIEKLQKKFDLVLANIDRDTITALKNHIVSVMHPGSVLMLSGLLTSQEQEIADMFHARGLETLRTSRGSGAGDSCSDEWACLVMTHPLPQTP